MTNAQRRRRAKAAAKMQRMTVYGYTPTAQDRTRRERSFNRAFHLYLQGQGR